MLTRVADGIWCARQEMKLVGCNFGTRMSAVRLPGGGLWLYSPVKLTSQLRAELDELGTVTHLVSPNNFHHIFLRDYTNAFPEARLYGMPDLAKKRIDLGTILPLTDLAADAFGPDLECLIFHGRRGFRELLAYHRPSATLLVCDLAFNIQVVTNLWEHFFFSLYGVKAKFGPSFVGRLMSKNEAGRDMWPKLLAWDFQRIIPCHGEILDRNVKTVFRHAFAYME